MPSTVRESGFVDGTLQAIFCDHLVTVDGHAASLLCKSCSSAPGGRRVGNILPRPRPGAWKMKIGGPTPNERFASWQARTQAFMSAVPHSTHTQLSSTWPLIARRSSSCRGSIFGGSTGLASKFSNRPARQERRRIDRLAGLLPAGGEVRFHGAGGARPIRQRQPAPLARRGVPRKRPRWWPGGEERGEGRAGFLPFPIPLRSALRPLGGYGGSWFFCGFSFYSGDTSGTGPGVAVAPGIRPVYQ